MNLSKYLQSYFHQLYSIFQILVFYLNENHLQILIYWLILFFPYLLLYLILMFLHNITKNHLTYQNLYNQKADSMELDYHYILYHIHEIHHDSNDPNKLIYHLNNIIFPIHAFYYFSPIPNNVLRLEIGRAHVWTPVTL